MARNVHSADPLLGIAGGWSPSDQPPGYTSPKTIGTFNTTAVVLSDAINLGANSITLSPIFDKASTSCTIELLADDGTGTFGVVATFTGVSMATSDGLSFGRWPQRSTLNGRDIKVRVSNLTAGGSVTVKGQRLN